jgi:hypothetical protein
LFPHGCGCPSAIAPGRVMRDESSLRWTLPGMSDRGKSSQPDGRSFRRWFLLGLGSVLMLDLAVGTAIFDNSTPAAGRFEASPAADYDRERASRIQDDGEAARFVERDGLWVISPVASETVNVDVSGSRRTVGNRSGEIRVAFVGGSAAFGLGQGDSGTIASEMARILNAGDVPVEVVNLGTPAWTIADAARALEARLSAGERFDAVVSYSGANEMYMGVLGIRVPTSLVEVTVGVMGTPSDSIPEHWADRSILARLAGRDPRPARTPLRIVDATTAIGALLNSTRKSQSNASPEEALDKNELIRFNYAEGARMIDELGVAHDFAVLHVVQPFKNNASGNSNAMSSLLATSAPGLLDLTGILPASCFYDQVHTTEVCSSDVASAIVSEFQSRDMGTLTK